MVAIVVIIFIGLNFHPLYLSTNAWMWIVGLYILVASVTPVWILLQPRDYLSSFLLYAMLALAAIAVVIGHPSMDSLPVFNAPRQRDPGVPRAIHHHRLRRYFRFSFPGRFRHYLQAVG